MAASIDQCENSAFPAASQNIDFSKTFRNEVRKTELKELRIYLQKRWIFC